MAGEIPTERILVGCDWIETGTVWRHRAAPSAEKYKAALDCWHHKSVEQESSLVCQEIKKVKVAGNQWEYEKAENLQKA